MIGIFGGSFDPPHRGHAQILLHFRSQFPEGKLILVPNYLSPLKSQKNVSPDHILNMLRLFRDDLGLPEIEIAELEISKKEKSYTIDTLQYFSGKYPEDEIYLLIGEDNFHSFHLWKDYDVILEKYKVLVFRRPGCESIAGQIELEKYNHKVFFMDNQKIDISSSEWRVNLSEDSVSHSIYQYCMENRLYGL